MADKIERAQGKCPEHGVVEGVRCLPKLTVPLPLSVVVYLVRSRAARRAPFTCPQCERELTFS